MKQQSNKKPILIPLLIMVTGIALRFIVYIDNRCLWTDEVSVALNIHERSFSELVQPLAYKQYAPPIFLWLIKLSTILFGYGEQALRLYPLFSGIVLLFVFYSVLKKNTSVFARWYPLLILATGFIYLRYSTEVKQYMPDAFIATALVWLALRLDILKPEKRKFIITWLIAGSVAIWSSMPSVFVLAAIGLYYSHNSSKEKQRSNMLVIAGISAVWLLQFLLYYFTILKPQINSEYLVNYHSKYFLFGLPSNSEEWGHNKDLLIAITESTFGKEQIIVVINSILILTGIAGLLYRNKAGAILYITPVLLMVIAAGLNQYSLIPRLTLFSMPFLLLLAGMGLDTIIKTKPAVIKYPVIVALFTVIMLDKPWSIINHPIREEQLTGALDYMNTQQINGKQLYVYTGAYNLYRYYTSIHPKQEKYSSLRNAIHIEEGTDLDSLLQYLPERAALLYTIPFDSYVTKQKFEQYARLADSYHTDGCDVFIFRKNEN